jgi:hypothetical protein
MRVIYDRCMPEILNFGLIITILKETKQYYDKSKVIVTEKKEIIIYHNWCQTRRQSLAGFL